MAELKTALLFSSITQTVGTTTQPANIPGQVWTGFNRFDVLFVVHTITGLTSTAGVTIDFQEYFPCSLGPAATTGYVTTARLINILTAGVYVATYDDSNGTATTVYASPSTAKNALLGKGGIKQIVTTAGAITAFNMDVVIVPWNH